MLNNYKGNYYNTILAIEHKFSYSTTAYLRKITVLLLDSY